MLREPPARAGKGSAGPLFLTPGLGACSRPPKARHCYRYCHSGLYATSETAFEASVRVR